MNDSVSFASEVQALVDRSAITDCLHRYARGMDRHDREMVRSVYHHDAIDVHGSKAFGVEDFIDWAFAYHAEQLHHQHYLTNVTIELEDDAAHSETYYLFVARYPDREKPLTVAGGRYVDRFERRSGQWAISKRVCTAEWRTTAPSKLPDRGTPTVVPEVVVSHDMNDVSYVRPLSVELLADARE
jgi:hypothetical protein